MNKRYIFSFMADPMLFFSIGLMLLNDHFLKQAGVFPLLTGKLSDFAFLFSFPYAFLLLILYCRHLARIIRRKPPDFSIGWRSVLAANLMAALPFFLIKTFPVFNTLFGSVLTRLDLLHLFSGSFGTRMDPTDNIALPACAANFLWLSRRHVLKENQDK